MTPRRPRAIIFARMPTPSEQKALAFVAIVILLGGAVRVLRAGASPTPTRGEQQALARQAIAADSASQNARRGKPTRRGKVSRPSRDTTPHVVGGVASVPPQFARPGFSAPTPRIDSYAAGARPPRPGVPAGGGAGTPAGQPMDLDRATVREVEALPRIGPALAKRIVANRDSLGAFGNLAALGRVKGIGPALLETLAPLVTFGGTAAPRARPP